MRVECQSCHATYDTIQRDGTEYYHACAPLSVPELRAAIAAGAVTLSPAKAKRLAALERQPPAPDADLNASSAADRFLAQLTIERPNKRDENVRVDPTTRAVTLVAAGAGVLEVIEIE